MSLSYIIFFSCAIFLIFSSNEFHLSVLCSFLGFYLRLETKLIFTNHMQTFLLSFLWDDNKFLYLYKANIESLGFFWDYKLCDNKSHNFLYFETKILNLFYWVEIGKNCKANTTKEKDNLGDLVTTNVSSLQVFLSYIIFLLLLFFFYILFKWISFLNVVGIPGILIESWN